MREASVKVCFSALRTSLVVLVVKTTHLSERCSFSAWWQSLAVVVEATHLFERGKRTGLLLSFAPFPLVVETAHLFERDKPTCLFRSFVTISDGAGEKKKKTHLFERVKSKSTGLLLSFPTIPGSGGAPTSVWEKQAHQPASQLCDHPWWWWLKPHPCM